LLSVFGDESADETTQRVFATPGLAAWLERTGGIPFHAKDCESDQADYAHTAHEDNLNLYRDLTLLLAKSGLCGFGFAVDLQAQRNVFLDDPDLAYHKGFAEVVTAMTNFAVNSQETVKFTFDSRLESNFNAGLLADMFLQRTEIDPTVLGEFYFAFSRKNPRLQAADLMARETMKSLDNQVGPLKRLPRKSWLALYETERFKIEAIGQSWFESLREQCKKNREYSQVVTMNGWRSIDFITTSRTCSALRSGL